VRIFERRDKGVHLGVGRSSHRRPSPNEEAIMKYVLLIHQGDTPTPYDQEAWGALSEDERNQIYRDYMAVNQTPGVTPAGVQLAPPETATTVRVEGGQTLTTDGPFVTIKEALGGWLVYEADDLDAAIELAARIPAARLGGAIEVRPVTEP
jgi:hypothetical protein